MAREFNPREMMELAIEVMRNSVSEPRNDRKACPRVGVVMRKSDGVIETASRGELRHGDHAEFTLLERKNRSARLDDAILFTTLEPCAPGSREPPKMSCAERIVLARVASVWVGVEDPDPTVDRKGIKYLQEAGVEVQMFDRDLQEVIREDNDAFFEQALERAAAELETAAPITLSSFERPVNTAILEDFSLEALERYRAVSKTGDAVTSEDFRRRLLQQGLLSEHDGKLVPTGFGLLLFGKEPRLSMPHAGLLGTIHYPDGREETRDFEGPMIFAPEQALQWLRDKLPNPIERTDAQRKEVNEALYELAREGIVNALVHREYGIEQAKIQLSADSDTITIMSPGGPVEPITIEQLQAFDAPMLSRNPPLHFVFAKLDLAEERGLGLKSMRMRATQAGLPLPKYSWKDPYLILTLYRTPESAVRVLPREAAALLSRDERDGWEFLASRTTVTRSEYADHFGFDPRKAQRHLRRFVELGLLERLGGGRSAQYRIRRP